MTGEFATPLSGRSRQPCLYQSHTGRQLQLNTEYRVMARWELRTKLPSQHHNIYRWSLYGCLAQNARRDGGG